VRIKSKSVRGFLLRAIGPLGIDVSQRTDRADLVELLRSLHPLDSGVELVRVGPMGDGGYLLPDDLDGIDYVFSPGVSDESGFEMALADRGMQVFLADRSVDGAAEQHQNFTFEKQFVGCLSDEAFTTLDDWKQRHLPDYTGDLLLQMDIEGFEYETLLAASAGLLAQFRIMVIEIHFLDQLLNKPWFDLVSRFFAKLMANHSVVHIHPNNCCGSVKAMGLELPRILEMTLFRNDRLRRRQYANRYPHPLDADNTRHAPLHLPRCWYRDSN